MDTIDAIQTRRSIRKFKEKDTAWSDIIPIIEAGQYAPSAGNLQNWKFIIIRDQKTRHKIADACHEQDWLKDAPTHIAIVAEPYKAHEFYGERGESQYTTQSCAAVAQNMMLAAHNGGLGSCWVGAFEEDKIKDILGFPEKVVCHAIIAIGEPAETPQVPSRKAMHLNVYVDAWGNKGYGDYPKGFKSTAWKEAASQLQDHIHSAAERLKKSKK
ncbi:MAG: nitroreductase family protein [Nanoarchaeota archaeon]|nr:nitroreductase family protein [Nanoarchaeota archaeon]